MTNRTLFLIAGLPCLSGAALWVLVHLWLAS
jgi:hypothetical protein